MKRLWIAGLSLFLFLAIISVGVKIQAAEEYPTKPIIAIVPFEPGAGGDIKARPMLEKASAILGKPIVIVNKPGAGQTIGYREIYRAKPDGYTIGTTSATIVTAKLLGLFSYDYRDFTLLGRPHHSVPIVIASTKRKNPFKTIEEVLSFAKSHPGEIVLATTAVGGPYWTAAMLVQEGTGLKFNLVPQEGSGGFVVTQVAGGHVDLGILGVDESRGQIEAGNVRPLAVIGSERFSGRYSHIPTLKEAGYDISVRTFLGVIGPPKIPEPIVEKLVRVFETAGTDPEYVKFLLTTNNFPNYMKPDPFFKFCEEERRMHRSIFEKAGLLKEK